MNRIGKAILAITLILSPAVLKAGNVSVKKATSVAETFFIKYGLTTRSGSTLKLINNSDIVLTRSGEETAPFYIFNRAEGGFVIISGIEAAEPVLAYSLDNKFGDYDKMPDNLKFWLGLYKEQVDEHRLMGNGVTASERAKWDEALARTRADVPKAIDLQTPDFGQGDPFNRLCPLDSAGQTVVAGCVTIAAAQIMAFYKYPKHGTGILPGYEYKGIVVPDFPLGHDYDWDNILPKYQDVNFTDVQANAVATLVRDVAFMGQVEFNHSSTTGNTNFTFPNMRIYMGYDKSILRYPGWNMTQEEFKQAILGTLKKGEPVTFSGTSTSGGGHAFVGDGYDENDKILINWGWNGSSNGYYISGVFGSYTKELIVYTNLKPDFGGEEQFNLQIQNTTLNSVAYTGIMPQTCTLTKGGTITTKFGAIYNYGFVNFKGELTFAHMDRNGNIKGFMIDTPFEVPELEMKGKYGISTNFKLTIPADIERGDYVEPLFRYSGRTEWCHFYNALNNEDTVLGTLPLHLRDYTKIKYTKSTGAIALTTMRGSSYTITNADGTAVRSGKIASDSLSIKLKTYGAGTYTLTITNGDQSISFQIKVA